MEKIKGFIGRMEKYIFLTKLTSFCLKKADSERKGNGIGGLGDHKRTPFRFLLALISGSYKITTVFLVLLALTTTWLGHNFLLVLDGTPTDSNYDQCFLQPTACLCSCAVMALTLSLFLACHNFDCSSSVYCSVCLTYSRFGIVIKVHCFGVGWFSATLSDEFTLLLYGDICYHNIFHNQQEGSSRTWKGQKQTWPNGVDHLCQDVSPSVVLVQLICFIVENSHCPLSHRIGSLPLPGAYKRQDPGLPCLQMCPASTWNPRLCLCKHGSLEFPHLQRHALGQGIAGPYVHPGNSQAGGFQGHVSARGKPSLGLQRLDPAYPKNGNSWDTGDQVPEGSPGALS